MPTSGVKAIQESRQKRPAPVAQQQGSGENPYATVQQMMGKPPGMPSGLNTPLGDAQPFDYQPGNLSDDVPDLAARGVSEAEEAECYAAYEFDLDQCSFGRATFQSPAYYVECKARAFAKYQQCRGY